jgi:hypothetical protein
VVQVNTVNAGVVQVNTVMIRRLKGEVLQQLPPKQRRKVRLPARERCEIAAITHTVVTAWCATPKIGEHTSATMWCAGCAAEHFRLQQMLRQMLHHVLHGRTPQNSSSLRRTAALAPGAFDAETQKLPRLVQVMLKLHGEGGEQLEELQSDMKAISGVLHASMGRMGNSASESILACASKENQSQIMEAFRRTAKLKCELVADHVVRPLHDAAACTSNSAKKKSQGKNSLHLKLGSKASQNTHSWHIKLASSSLAAVGA